MSVGTKTVSPVLDQALIYASLGLKVVPNWGLHDDLTCRCRKGKNCGSPGKHPMLTGWHLHASDDEDQIIEWFDELYPDANVGVQLGERSGIVDIESDTPEGAKRLQELFGTSIITPTYQSSRGKHHLFKYSDELPAQATYSFDGIDVKIGANAKGSQSVFPPSRHKSGCLYSWLPNLSLEEVPLADIPEAVLVAIANRTGGEPGGTSKRRSSEHWERVASGVGEGERNTSLLSVAGKAMRKCSSLTNYGDLALARNAVEGTNARYLPPLGCDEVQSILDSAFEMEVARRRGEDAPKSGGEDVPEGAGEVANEVANEIIVSGDINRMARMATDVLKSRNDPPRLFLLGDALSRLKTSVDGGIVTEPLNERTMDFHMLSEIIWQKQTKKDLVPSSPPIRVARNILANPALPFPQLTRIVHAPVFASDGTLHSEPGYNAASRCYYDPRGFECPQVSEKPTAAELKEAKRIIFDDVLVDFKFAEQASCCHALALALGPFVREMINGPTPIHLIYKPRAGVGGGLLTSVLTTPFLGREPSPVTAPSSEDEWRKKITAALAEAPSIFYIDNANDIDSASLAAATTTTRFKDRVLGSSTVADLPVRCTWVAVGNNPTLTQEIRRRCLPIRLITDGPEPELRSDFEHPQLRWWCTENRGKIVWALLTIVRHWIAQGRPMSKAVFGSYEEWVRIMGGVLKAAGVTGFLENLTEVKDLDTEGAGEQAMVQGWVEKGWHKSTLIDTKQGEKWKQCGKCEECENGERCEKCPQPLTGKLVAKSAVDHGVVEKESPRAAGKMLARLNGKTFVVTDDGESREVALVLDRGDAKRGNTFKLIGVSK